MIIRNSGVQVAWVGDPSQQIHDFNDAENAMARLDDLATDSFWVASTSWPRFWIRPSEA